MRMIFKKFGPLSQRFRLGRCKTRNGPKYTRYEERKVCHYQRHSRTDCFTKVLFTKVTGIVMGYRNHTSPRLTNYLLLIEWSGERSFRFSLKTFYSEERPKVDTSRSTIITSISARVFRVFPPQQRRIIPAEDIIILHSIIISTPTDWQHVRLHFRVSYE